MGYPLCAPFPRSNLALLLAVVAAFAAPAAASAADGQVIVKYASGADAQDRADARDDAGVVRDEALPLPSTELVTPEAGASIADAVADLERSRDVAYAEPDHTRHAFDLYPDEARVDANGAPAQRPAVREPVGPAQHRPGDPAPPRPRGRGHRRTGRLGRHDGQLDRQGRGRRLGRRPDPPRPLRQPRPGYDFAYNDSDPTDYDGHGTHVAGIIAARGNNGIGVTGVAWQTSLIPVEALDATGEGTTSDIVAAYGYAVSKGARIVNASFGGSSFSQSEYNAIKAAPNVLFVAAAGNETANDDTTPSYPCAYNLPNILCVAATDDNDGLASFSNYGRTSVDIAAPGVSIYSTYRCDGYAWMSGTSMATPEVSGAAALVLAKFPTLSRDGPAHEAPLDRRRAERDGRAQDRRRAPRRRQGGRRGLRADDAPGSTTNAGDGSGSSAPGHGVRRAARR